MDVHMVCNTVDIGHTFSSSENSSPPPVDWDLCV